MTPRENISAADAAVEVLIANGMEGLAGAVEILLNTAMRIERSNYLGVGPYERSEDRVSHANGFKPRHLDTRLGALDLQVPQTRDCQFYPQSLEKGMRSERALRLALAEMYVQGVSTRRVAEITEKLCGLNVVYSLDLWLPPSVLFIVAFAGAIILGHITYIIIEKPIIRWFSDKLSPANNV